MRLAIRLFPIALLTSSVAVADAVVTPIGDLHSNTPAGVPLRNGEVVTVQGTVTVPTGIFSTTNVDVHIQDATGAIDAFLGGGIGTYTLALGDSVEVTGPITQFNGLTEISPINAVVHLGPATVPPEPLVMTCQQLTNSYLIGDVEPNESLLTRINGVSIVGGAWPTVGNNATLTISDASGTAQLFIDRDTAIDGSPQPAPGFDLIGVIRQFDTSSPFTTGHQIVPRFLSDVIGGGVVGCTGPSFTDGPITSVVDSLSATIIWTTDTPASSFVRYGVTPTYTDSTGDGTPTTSHSVALTGLLPRTLYHFQAKSTDIDGTCYSVERAFVTFPSPGTPGDIAVYFNQSVDHSVNSGTLAAGNVDLTQPLLALINSADVSLDCALYYFDFPAITDALIAAKNRGVEVRLITGHQNPQTEAQRLGAEGIPYIASNFGGNHGAGIMHDKYVIKDVKSSDKNDAYLWTGSWNCFPGAQLEANNAIVLHDYGLSAAYTVDFNQMWGSSTMTPNATLSKMGDRKTDIIPHLFKIGGRRVEAWMSPSDQPEVRMIQYIQQAQHSQLFCIFDFTSDPLSLAMKVHRDSLPGFVVRGLFDAGQVGEFSEWCKLDGQPACGGYWSPRADVLQDVSANYTLLHHKYQILDHGYPGLATVWTGSHNWSNAAKTTNDENTVVIHDLTIANLYYQEWHARHVENGGTVAVGPPTTNQILALSPCRPNPTSGTTQFEYSVAGLAAEVSLGIYDLAGRRVKILVKGPVEAGTYQAIWDGRNEAGHRERAGVYFCRLKSASESVTRLLVLTP